MKGAIAGLLLAASLSSAGAQAVGLPPAVPREFRGVWLVTVNNSDWPSRPGLSTWEQQQELLALLNKAVELKLNAVIFHVRTGADAFYDSPYEPWAQFLTGVQGRAPEPAWDPLAFAVAEAHKRGLELHAWFNPYKAEYTKDTAVAARNQVVHERPDIVYPYGRFVWMDPGIPEVRRRALRAVMDVVRRYDVDGVHIDDFFYPYPEKDSSGATIEFPDSATYRRYRSAGGTLPKDAWRRHNIDVFIKALYRGVKKLKPWVKVGISPIGIWRPGNPPQIKGFDAYAQIYADSRKWLERGWLDYFTPQLYWKIDPPEHSYPVLLDWWLSQNPKHRHIWPGLFTGRVGATAPPSWPVEEIVRQVGLTRERAANGATGNVHFPMKVFVRDPDSLDEQLGRLYAVPALVPASPWLDARVPGRPEIRVMNDAATGDKELELTPAKRERVWLWTVRTQVGDAWTTEVLPGTERKHRLASGDLASRVYVTAVGRTGNESRAAVATVRHRAGTGIPLRVMSYNIRAGNGNLEGTAAAIRALSPDVVALQEVDVHWSDRSNFVDEAAALGERLAMHVRFARIYKLADSSSSQPPREFGVALLSRYPITAWRNDTLTRLSTQEANPVPARMPGLLEATIDVRGTTVRVFNTHLDYRSDPRVRQQQVTELLADVDGLSEPTIVFGDMNATPDAPELRPLLERLHDAWPGPPGTGLSYPADAPTQRIDYVLVSPQFRVRSASVPVTEASDHRPVVADVVLGGPPQR